MPKTTPDIIVERFLEWGIDTYFGLPGDGINGFFEPLRQHRDRIRFVHCRHEEAASLAAVGHAKFTGRPAVCVSTTGPGALHMINGLHDAKLEGAPLIAITGMTYHDLIGTHFLQDINQDYVFDNACVFNQRVMGPAHATYVADLAVRNALGHRGPSHIAIPVDVQAFEYTGDLVSAKNMPNHTSVTSQRRIEVPPREELERAAEVLKGATKIVICAGQGARGAGDELEEVAETLGAPIAKASLGKDCVPDDSPYTTGGLAFAGTRPTQAAMEECDGFLIVGSSTTYYDFWPQPGQARAVQIDDDPARIALRYPVDYLGNPQYGCDFSYVDFAKVAEGFGLKSVKIERLDECREKLREALSHDGPALVECVVDANESPFAETLKPNQAENIATAFSRGEPDREDMARKLLREELIAVSPGLRSAKGDIEQAGLGDGSQR